MKYGSVAVFMIAASLARSAAVEPPRAARSVHFRWHVPDGELFYDEVRVLESVPSSYFVAAGWDRGYFGIQEHATRDMVLFSVWDPVKGDDPAAVPSADRVAVLYADPEARIRRFGREGTGAQCKYPYAWTIGRTYRFLVRARTDEEGTAYTAWFYLDEKRRWVKLATFRVPAVRSPLKGYYSFIEDFRRDGQSPGETRRARFGPVWARSVTGGWEPAIEARFTADETPLWNVDASTRSGFELATGGRVKNSVELNSVLSAARPASGPPADLPEEVLR
jgi:hypothetical protein